VFRIGLVVVLISVGLAGSAQAGAPTAPTMSSAGRATLKITDVHPLSISGRGFKARERVVVSTSGRRKTVMTSSAGRFAVSFAGIRCAAGAIRAVGSKGSRATTTPPKIVCVAP
jgi:hypothetical protein